MGKPYTLSQPTPEAVPITRDAAGKFRRLELEPAGEVIEQADDSGEAIEETSRRVRVPDHPISQEPDRSGVDPVYSQEIPWPPAGPINDTNTKPMKLK
jgi:hypothetical protein